MPPRQRLSPAERRSVLLDAGQRLFSAGGFETISMADIAVEAGVSRRLLYHYFPTKAEFFGAMWQRAHEQLRLSVSDIGAETVRDMIDHALSVYARFYAQHLPLVIIANRSSISHDPAVRGPIERDLAALCSRLLDAAGAEGHERELAEVGFAGWITFVRATSLAALVDRRITAAEGHALCMAVLDAAVGAYVDLGVPAVGDRR